MDVVLLSRLQFALTIMFHFIFPPISIGLAWYLVIIETLSLRTGKKVYAQIAQYFVKLLAVTFVVGVATGIVMEFQFGTNWAKYSEFVGDIFGAPLAAEGVFAFFLESGFMGLYLFGRDRVSKTVHWFAGLMVALGATLSAFWIIVAGSWMQTPAGYVINNGRAELVNFWAAVFNPSTLPRYFHTITSCLVAGSFLVIGVCAYLILKKKAVEMAKAAMKIGMIMAVISSIIVVFPFGHEHARQVARTQPEKFAAIEGLYTSQAGAPLVVFAYPTNRPPELKAPIHIPGLLSWMAFGNTKTTIRGINEFPADEIPPLWLTFVSFHNMVLLGMLFIAVTLWGTLQLVRNNLWGQKKFLAFLVFLIPFPLFAIELGWITAEVGRQPWIVYKLMRTHDAVSKAVSGEAVLFSIVLFGCIYLLLGALYGFLMVREINHLPAKVK